MLIVVMNLMESLMPRKLAFVLVLTLALTLTVTVRTASAQDEFVRADGDNDSLPDGVAGQ